MFINDYDNYDAGAHCDIEYLNNRINETNRLLEAVQKEVCALRKMLDILQRRMSFIDMNGLEELRELLGDVCKPREASRIYRILVLANVNSIDILADWSSNDLQNFANTVNGIGKQAQKVLEEAVNQARIRVAERSKAQADVLKGELK